MSHPITITIDGKEVQVEDGTLLINAIREAGVDVPSLCYYEHIDPPLGTCRVCTVEVNGRHQASCTTLARNGMSVVVHDDPTLHDTRKAMVEMLFAEGNHFCPACEKSGDCDLQGMGYDLGVQMSRFPHLFIDRIIDYNPKRMVIEHNRCIRCRRCVDEVLTDDGKRVFSFAHRGNDTEVAIDYDQEAKLTEEQAVRAMHICPTGSILVRGKSLARPFGERKYDIDGAHAGGNVPMEKPFAPKVGNGEKKVIATVSLAGCFGCHMSMLDLDMGILDLVDLVEFNKSPLTDIKEFTKRVDIGLIEGGCCNSENVHVLREFRRKCDILVSVGECSIWGGLPAMRNMVPLRECLEEAYLHSFTSENEAAIIPHHEDIPQILDKVYACSEVVDIDYFIPGCPPSANHIWKMVKNILFGAEYSVVYPEFKYD
jgi:coenzyme F420-reducing hydrogenase gamma subunit/aerobic-type carbon monoxide dehydrogenase small subunit (CoxS/CutS family)/ferredoxin